jgi:CBS domain-containing protein
MRNVHGVAEIAGLDGDEVGYLLARSPGSSDRSDDFSRATPTRCPVNQLTSRFLSAFNRIEKRLKALAGAGSHVAFFQLIDRAASTDRAVARHRARLRRLGNMRNMFVHEHDHDSEVAIPTEQTVTAIESLAAALESPPLLLSLSAQDVKQCQRGDPVGAAARAMYDGAFSQLPVYDGARLVGLLTGETIARWLIATHAPGREVNFNEPVHEVLTHREPTTTHALLPQSATVFDGLARFEEALHQGQALLALLITTTGEETDPLLGIVTPTDIPRLVRKANV